MGRRERLRRLALETIDLEKDPYFMKNHVGQYECRLCLTLHTPEESSLAHTQAKRHQQNLARRAARETKEKIVILAPQFKVIIKKTTYIGRPGYRVTKQFDKENKQCSLLLQIDFSEIEDGSKPHQRFMSAYEQRKEPIDRKYQYVLFHAEPYEVIAFKVPSYEIDRENSKRTLETYQDSSFDLSERKNKIFAYWDSDNKVYTLQLYFKALPGRRCS